MLVKETDYWSPFFCSKIHKKRHFIVVLESDPFSLLPFLLKKKIRCKALNIDSGWPLSSQDFMSPPLGLFSTSVTSVSRRPAEQWYRPKLSLTLSGGGEQMLLRHSRCRPPCFRCLAARLRLRCHGLRRRRLCLLPFPQNPSSPLPPPLCAGAPWYGLNV